MMTKKQSIIFTYGLMNTAMCLCMATTALIVNVGFLTLPMFVVTFVQALIICNLCTLIFRIPALEVVAVAVSLVLAPFAVKLVMSIGTAKTVK